MYLFEGVQISAWLAPALLVVCFIAMVRARVEFLAGVYIVNVYWQAPASVELFGIGDVSLIWILLPALFIASQIYLLQRQQPIVARADRRMLAWVVFWIIWIATLAWAFPFGGETLKSFLIAFGLELVVPVLVLSVFADDLERLRLFASTFIATTVGLALHAIVTWSGSSLLHFFQTDEALTWVGGYFSYHGFSRIAAISVFLALTLMVDPAFRTRRNSQLLMLALVVCAAFIVWSGSKQTLYTTLFVLPMYVAWLLRGRQSKRLVALGPLFSVLAVAVALFHYAPALFRLDSLSSGILGDRPAIFSRMWQWFLRSPIWGNGLFYERHLSHNLFLDALASQGITGFVFLIGFLGFVARYARGTWRGSASVSADVWRMGALVLLVLSLLQAQISGSVLGAQPVYWASVLIWRLSLAAGRQAQAERHTASPLLSPASARSRSRGYQQASEKVSS